MNQFSGVIVAGLLAVIKTLVSLKGVDLLIELRVTEMEELAGLDATQHGEVGYAFDPAPASD